jgi:hypothetical protein
MPGARGWRNRRMRGPIVLERMTGQALFGDMATSLSTMRLASYGV